MRFSISIAIDVFFIVLCLFASVVLLYILLTKSECEFATYVDVPQEYRVYFCNEDLRYLTTNR